MSDNVYKAPESELVSDADSSLELASRWSRLFAAIVDGLIIALVTIPLMYLTGGFDVIETGEQPSLIYSLMMAVLGVVVFFAINVKFLKATGQPLGKKLLGIKMGTMDGALPGLGDHFLKRYAVYLLPGQIPLVGQLFSLVNILFIFSGTKRCIHDLAAGTQVVKC